jgi:PAS domain S-box-containing protein
MGLLADQAAIAIRNKRAEEELRAANSETETLLTSISWILVAVDGRHRITRWNAAAESTFGIPAERVVGRPLQEAGVGWDWATIGERIDECRARQHPSRAGDVRYQRPDGREGILSITASLIGDQGDGESGLLLLGSDITELRVLEVQLSHAQKLESIGQLAAGVAHEINTPIQFVGDNVHFLEDSFRGLSGLLAKYRKITAVPPGSPLDPVLEEVRQAEEAADVEYLIEEVPRAIGQTVDGINRVATIVRAMKEFAHPDQGTDRVLTDINQALTSTLTVARNEIKYVADVDTDFGELPLVVCLPGDLNQVFLNLIINAAHAIGAVVRDTRGKGRIGVRTRVDGDSVLIAISDTGTGVPEHIRGRIFDPFFTTKEVGKGTGQGLAIARNVVVDKHGGTLTFETEMGRGTTFLIRLPVAGRNG